MNATRPRAALPRGFVFWHRWLQVSCLLFALQALSWCWTGSFDPFGWWDRQAARGFLAATLPSGLAECLAPRELAAFQRFWVGLVGASTAAYFLLLGLLVRHALLPGASWAWWTAGGSLLLWFIADSAVSFRAGADFNVWLVNLPCLAVNMVPLAALRAACCTRQHP
jgi:hypothetical protein